jgi:hypothetical protein
MFFELGKLVEPALCLQATDWYLRCGGGFIRQPEPQLNNDLLGLSLVTH